MDELNETVNLAVLDKREAEVRALLSETPLEAYTKTTLTDPDAIIQELRKIRAKGYAFDNEEREIGVRCVAAPVRDGKGEVIAALSLSAPASRLPHRQAAKVAQRVVAAADQISARLGWGH